MISFQTAPFPLLLCPAGARLLSLAALSAHGTQSLKPMDSLHLPVPPPSNPSSMLDLNPHRAPTEEYADLTALRKIQTQAMVPRVVCSLFLTVLFYCLGCYWSALSTACTVAINLLALPLLWLTKRTGFARDLAANGTCLCLMANLWLFGGGPWAGGLIAFAYIEQIQQRVQVSIARNAYAKRCCTVLYGVVVPPPPLV